MKLYIIILSALILLAGCGEKKENSPAKDPKTKYAFDTTDLKTKTIKNSAASVNFKYRFEKGTRYYYRITTISEDKQIIKTDTSLEQNVKQNVVYLFDFEPALVDKDGTTELNCNIGSIKLDASSGSQKFAFNSDDKNDSAQIARFSEYQSLIKSPFSVRISSNGEVLEVFRADKMLTKYLAIKGYQDSVSAQQKEMIRQDLITGVLKPLVTQVFREMPSESIPSDSSWSVSQNPQRFMIYQITNTNQYKIASMESLEGDTLVKLNASLDTKISGDSKVTERGITYQFQKPVTSADGTIYFNITDGMIQKSKTSTTIEITYTMEANTPQGNQKGIRTEKIRNVNLVERL
jgi:hypothetical protein